MKKDTLTQDNEPLTFQTLGLAAALVINRIRIAQTLRELASEQKEDREEHHQADSQAKERPEQHREDVEGRLSDLAVRKQKGGTI